MLWIRRQVLTSMDPLFYNLIRIPPTNMLAASFHFVCVPLYCRKYKKLLRQEKSTEKKNKYKKGDKHEVCSTFWIHYSIEKP